MNAKLENPVKKHPLHGRWTNLFTRCRNPKAINYHLYGGRGIRVCERWHSFAVFCADMEPTWQPGLTLERIDNDADYSPENCRWATPAEQNRNQRNNIIVDTPWGRMHLADAAIRSGIKYVTLHWRHRHGRALFAPLHSGGHSGYGGRYQTRIIIDTPLGRLSLKEAAALSGVPRTTLRYRHQRGQKLF